MPEKCSPKNGPREKNPQKKGPRKNRPRKNGPRKIGPRKNKPRKNVPRKIGPRKNGPTKNGPRTIIRYATLCMPSVACVRGVHGIRAYVACMRGLLRDVSTIRKWLACVSAYVWGVREWRAGMRMCSIVIFNFYPASTFESACPPPPRPH